MSETSWELKTLCSSLAQIALNSNYDTRRLCLPLLSSTHLDRKDAVQLHTIGAAAVHNIHIKRGIR